MRAFCQRIVLSYEYIAVMVQNIFRCGASYSYMVDGQKNWDARQILVCL